MQPCIVGSSQSTKICPFIGPQSSAHPIATTALYLRLRLKFAMEVKCLWGCVFGNTLMCRCMRVCGHSFYEFALVFLFLFMFSCCLYLTRFVPFKSRISFTRETWSRAAATQSLEEHCHHLLQVYCSGSAINSEGNFKKAGSRILPVDGDTQGEFLEEIAHHKMIIKIIEHFCLVGYPETIKEWAIRQWFHVFPKFLWILAKLR